jgi:hypothetical protein
MNQELDNLVFNRLQSKETESPETGICLKLFLKFPLIMCSDYDMVLNCQVFQQENNNFKLFSDVFIIELPHVEQVANWDCGLACIQMVLSSDLAVQLCQNLSTICPDEYQNKRLVNRKIITKMLH